MDTIITLRNYLEKGKTFVIPNYQRGYVWGKKRKGEDTDAVTSILQNLLDKFQNDEEVFLQGFTVVEKENEIVLVDGQQRTTFLYILLKYLKFDGKFNIRYDIRRKSGEYLKDIINKKLESKQEEYQDIHFFNKTLDTITSILESKSIKKSEILTYLLDNVKFLYIKIPEGKATTVFTMMNGAKAQMRPEEIIKAEILRLASSNNSLHSINNEYFAIEWDENLLRSRYAREWDKWLHWWKQSEVKDLFRTNDNPMELLLLSCQQIKKREVLTFESFKKKCLSGSSVKEAKMLFDKLRRMQKRFEDVYNDSSLHNIIGAILAISNIEERLTFINSYFVENEFKDEQQLNKYYLCRFMDLTHIEAMSLFVSKDDNDDIRLKFRKKYDAFFEKLEDDYLYFNNREVAFRTLLRLNIDQDIAQKRAFKFDIWEQRSLEHIFPKSKVWHWNEAHNQILSGEDKPIQRSEEEIKNDSNYLSRDNIKNAKNATTEHSLGNLVLLYKNENSKFNDSNFYHKKRLFFNPNENGLSLSRHLLHTVCVFAEKERWGGQEITDNKHAALNKLKEDYKQLKDIYYGE
jgi:hypothetical protein